MPERDIGACEDLLREVVHVPLVVDYLADARVDKDLGAQAAGECGGVDRGPLNARPVVRGLRHGVLLRMHPPAQFVTCARRYFQLFPETPRLLAVGDPFRSPVVTGGEDVAVLHDHRSHGPAEAGGTGGY